MNWRFRWLGIFVAPALSLLLNSPSPGQVRQPLSVEQRKTFNDGLRTLHESLDKLHDRPAGDLADAAIFPKGLVWALRYNQEFSPDDVKLLQTAVTRGRQRADALAAGELGRVPLAGKRPGLQGPIDDAFSSPFLCVRGTEVPWNATVQSHADASLKRFADEWQHYFRGELPIKDDTAVTNEDVQTRNLILFGDPGSNRWIAKMLPHLPLTWTREQLRFGGREYSAKNQVPALIAPNPLAGGEGHYVVLNSGHTFRESELSKLNYLLFPRWGDWAVLQIEPSDPGSKPLAETVLQSGYFDEQWGIRVR